MIYIRNPKPLRFSPLFEKSLPHFSKNLPHNSKTTFEMRKITFEMFLLISNVILAFWRH